MTMDFCLSSRLDALRHIYTDDCIITISSPITHAGVRGVSMQVFSERFPERVERKTIIDIHSGSNILRNNINQLTPVGPC